MFANDNHLFLGDHPETDEESELNARNQLNNHYHHHPRRRFSSERFVTEDSKFVPSDDEFAEDELSVGEPSEAKMLTLNGPAWGTCPVGGRFPRERRGKSPRSLDRRKRDKNHDLGEFHEGMLHLLPYFPSVAGKIFFHFLFILLSPYVLCLLSNLSV